jgi:pilus assembly protein CpaD
MVLLVQFLPTVIAVKQALSMSNLWMTEYLTKDLCCRSMRMTKHFDEAKRQKIGLLKPVAMAALLSFALAGCNTQKIHSYATSSIPAEYEQRHPIALTHGNQTLDIFAGHSARDLDYRQTEDVRAFAREYMTHGQGPLIAYLPANGPHTGLDAIRRALSGGGAAGRLQIAHYQSDAGTAAPIRLAFAKLKAQVNSHCSYAHEEVTPSNFKDNITNQQPNNFGCSFQKNIAAQVNDPRDFVRPRQEGPVDSTKRLAGIEKIRSDKGENSLMPAGTSLKETLGK